MMRILACDVAGELTIQEREPSLAVLGVTVVHVAPPSRDSSILTFSALLVDDHVIEWIVPTGHDSPPLGEVTFMPVVAVVVGGGAPLPIVKYPLLTSLTEALVVLVILTR